jgi:hypothetical protein
MHDAINTMNKILLFNGSILSLNSVIIASAKNNIAIFVRALYAVNKKLNWNMKKHDARYAYDSPTYFFDMTYMTNGEIEHINE